MLTTLFLHSYHFLPLTFLSLGQRALVSVSHEYIINIAIRRSYIFLITLVLQSIMTLEPLELVLCRKMSCHCCPCDHSGTIRQYFSNINFIKIIQRLLNWTGTVITLPVITVITVIALRLKRTLSSVGPAVLSTLLKPTLF